MDKNRIINDKKTLSVHRLPERRLPKILEQYGLWIFGAASVRANAHCFFTQNARYFEFYCLSHLWEGAGKAIINDKEYEMVPGDCVFVKPHTPNIYGSPSALEYCEDTITFTGPVADQLANAGIFREVVFHIGRIRRLLPIIRLVRDPAEDSLIRANIELQNLLVDLYLNRHRSKRAYPLFEKLQTEIRTHLDRWWTVTEMAEMCNLSDDQLRRIFLEYTGTTPKLYVDRLKIVRAGELLQTDDMSVAEIAENLGYMDPYHFSRRFKQIQGIAPEKYRENSLFSRKKK